MKVKFSAMSIWASLLSASLALYIFKISSAGNLFQNLIPFADLWVFIAVLILTSLVASNFFKASSYRVSLYAVCGLAFLIIGTGYALWINHAFEIYYAEYAHGGPARKDIYTSIITWVVSITGCILIILSTKFQASKNDQSIKLRGRLVAALAVVAALTGAYFALLTDASPYTPNTVNLGVVVMPIVNVFYGALPPVDVQSQYGLYAYFMMPILKIIGLNIFTISLVFAFLFFLCFIGIYFFTYSLTGSAITAFITMIASFYLNTSFGNIWPGELYFQYRPIRMLAPCMALLLFLFYVKAPTPLRRIFVLISLSALVLWNIDSGIPTLAAFVVANIIWAYFNGASQGWPARISATIFFLIEGVFILFSVLATFSLSIFIQRNEWVTPAMLFDAQRIFRGGQGFLFDSSQAIIFPTLIYAIAITLTISRGSNFGKLEFGALLVGLLGMGTSTYGTLNPQTAVVTTYLLPITLVLIVTILSKSLFRPHTGDTFISRIKQSRFELLSIEIFFLLPVTFLATSFIFHIKGNTSYTTVPTVLSIIYPSKSNNQGLWTTRGLSDSDVAYVRVKDLAAEIPAVPPWVQKASWLKGFSYLHKGRVFVASMEDHYLYAAIEQSSPIRIVNYYHIGRYKSWPMLFENVQEKNFNYIVIDESYLLRNSEVDSQPYFKKFSDLVKVNYSKIAETEISFEWYYPLWKPSSISIWERKASR